MIVDKLSNWRKYNLGDSFVKAFEYIESLHADAPAGRHEIDGKDVCASISDYATRDSEPEYLEVHRRFADLQITLAGSETLGWTLNRGLKVKAEYDQNKDCEFLYIPEQPLTWFEIDNATFAIFFPDDAHIGKVASSAGAGTIKKLVVKIAVASQD